jgi:hypothetical protein
MDGSKGRRSKARTNMGKCWTADGSWRQTGQKDTVKIAKILVNVVVAKLQPDSKK